jgi:excinuclease ABC subunit A
MVKQTEDQIVEQLIRQFSGKKIIILAPVIKGRKGHYRELFVQIRKSGYTRVRIDGDIREVIPKMQIDRYKVHDIEIVIDRMTVTMDDRYRVTETIKTAMKEGKGIIMVIEYDTGKVYHFSKFLMDPETGLFSFNSPYGACSVCHGLGEVEEITRESIIPDEDLSISRGGIAPLGEYRDIWIFKKIEAILKKYQVSLTTKIKNLPEEVIEILLYGQEQPVAVKSVKYPGTDWHTKFEGIIHFLQKQKDTGSEKIQKWVKEFTIVNTCPSCGGTRLKKESLHFKIADRNIAELAMMDIGKLKQWFENIENRLSEKQNIIGAEILKEIRKRIYFLMNVGLDYLDLNRPLRTLSGGEAQRIRLATQIGTQLVGVLYILDEPSIGLHQRDNIRLINALKDLRDLGNTVIVVEHDKEMMIESDFIIDIGPGPGLHGGHIVAEGPPDKFINNSTLTAAYLNGTLKIPVPETRRRGNGKAIRLMGARGNNLKNVNVSFPMSNFICVTGVSGSGKSSLIHDTLYPIINQKLYRSRKDPLPYDSIDGLENIDKVIEIDQSPIGRTPRSNPATYTGVFSNIRSLYADLPESKIRGYKPGRFSFNVKGGRCETCEGAGMRLIEMDFLPDVYVHCETCKGKRYNRETLEVRFKGKSIADVLEMTVENAVEFFENQPRILKILKTLNDVGLGYISLGQHATTLSGGEAQRVKLSSELAKKDTGKTFYILDEPTTGLHFQDIQHLIDVLQKLVKKGNTVLVIEHNMDIIKVADYIIDLGPEGGDEGGKVVFAGKPEDLISHPESYTGEYLKSELEK